MATLIELAFSHLQRRMHSLTYKAECILSCTKKSAHSLTYNKECKRHLVLDAQLTLVLIDFLDKFVVGLEVALQGCYHLFRV